MDGFYDYLKKIELELYKHMGEKFILTGNLFMSKCLLMSRTIVLEHTQKHKFLMKPRTLVCGDILRIKKSSTNQTTPLRCGGASIF